MHLRPEAQLEAKRGILLEGVERALRAPYPSALPLHGASEVSYRNRLRFHIAFVGGKPISGFRRRESHEIVDIERCLLGTSTLNGAWQRIRSAVSDDRRLARSLSSVELEESIHEPGRIAARFLVSSSDGLRSFDEGPRNELLTGIGLEGLVATVDQSQKPRKGGGPLVRAGRPFVEHRVSGFLLRQSVGSFFQSNRFLLEELVSRVVAESATAEAERGLDLFSGVGLFALPLARKLASVIGVEAHRLALDDARENAERAIAQGLSGGIRFLRGDASAYAARARLSPSDRVILDPPRGGLSPALIEALGKSPVRSIRYLSCDPPALFRDMGRLAAQGLHLSELELFDLFPNTHHFETLAVFSRQRRFANLATSEHTESNYRTPS
jgi:tRNA/tmRNA/rRNA uracil-C5-methylase (TrmA/RlmC/RlmD family)